jgi:hypothetical protein
LAGERLPLVKMDEFYGNGIEHGYLWWEGGGELAAYDGICLRDDITGQHPSYNYIHLNTTSISATLLR